MKHFAHFLTFLVLTSSSVAKADLWGGDLPLLAHIVTNTLNTLMELQRQSQFMQDEMNGIKDKIHRVQTIASLVQPNQWDKWKDPAEAINRLQRIYYTIPKEYRTEKSDMVEEEISKALNLVAKIQKDTESTFQSGKELESRGADASPGVAQKLTASGVGTLISQQAQSQVIQSQIASLLSQMLATGNEKENRALVSKGLAFQNIAQGTKTSFFSELVLGEKAQQ